MCSHDNGHPVRVCLGACMCVLNWASGACVSVTMGIWQNPDCQTCWLGVLHSIPLFIVVPYVRTRARARVRACHTLSHMRVCWGALRKSTPVGARAWQAALAVRTCAGNRARCTARQHGPWHTGPPCPQQRGAHLTRNSRPKRSSTPKPWPKGRCTCTVGSASA